MPDVNNGKLGGGAVLGTLNPSSQFFWRAQYGEHL